MLGTVDFKEVDVQPYAYTSTCLYIQFIYDWGDVVDVVADNKISRAD